MPSAKRLAWSRSGVARLAPDEVCVGGVGQAAGQGLVEAGLGAEEALFGTLTGEEGMVAFVAVGGQ